MKNETRSWEFGMIDQHNYVLHNNDRLFYQHDNSNDDAYWKVLVDAAEQLFNTSIKELEKASINRILEAFISGSISSQLAKKSILDSNAVLPIRVSRNEKEDLLSSSGSSNTLKLK